MNFKNIGLTSTALITLLLNGCAVTEIGVRHGDTELIIKRDPNVTWVDENLIKPLGLLMANSSVISVADWDEFDPSDFYMQIENESSATEVRSATASLYSYGGELATKSFEIIRMSNNVYLKNPENFKNWAEGYVDSSDEIKITLDMATTYFGSGSVTSKFYANGNLEASATKHNICNNGEMQSICMID